MNATKSVELFVQSQVYVSLGNCYDFTYFISGLCYNLISIIDGEFAFGLIKL